MGLCSGVYPVHNGPMMAKKTDDSPGKTGDAGLEDASARLSAALDLLDTKTTALLRTIKYAKEAGEVDEDRARLAAELDAAQARTAMLEGAAKEAGEALDSAIAEVRSALGEV